MPGLHLWGKTLNLLQWKQKKIDSKKNENVK